MQVLVDTINKITQEEAVRARQSKQKRSAAAKHAVSARDANLVGLDAQRHDLLEKCGWKVAAAVVEAETLGYGRGFSQSALAAYKRRMGR